MPKKKQSPAQSHTQQQTHTALQLRKDSGAPIAYKKKKPKIVDTELKSIYHEVFGLVSKELDSRKKREIEDQQRRDRGSLKRKTPKMPYPILKKIRTKEKERFEKEREEALNLGLQVDLKKFQFKFKPSDTWFEEKFKKIRGNRTGLRGVGRGVGELNPTIGKFTQGVLKISSRDIYLESKQSQQQQQPQGDRKTKKRKRADKGSKKHKKKKKGKK